MSLTPLKQVKIEVSKIESGNIHRLHRDKWRDIKELCLKINQSLFFNDQKINVKGMCREKDPGIQARQERLLKILIDDLAKKKIAKKMPEAIIIKNKDEFIKYKDESVDISNWVQTNGKKKFPLSYPEKDEAQHIIEQNSEGNYLFKGALIEMSRDTDYFKVFDIIYRYSNKDGFISYENIAKGLKWSEKNYRKKISNAIHKDQGIFRYAKINGKRLDNNNTKGQKLLEVVWNKGIRFNNS